MKENLKKGSRAEVTVIFADMKDFTKISEQFDPEDIDTIISRIFSNFETIIKQYEGKVEKYIGDALVAVFGATKIHEDDPIRAINASIDFLQELNALNISKKNKYRHVDIIFRIGINTGLVTLSTRGEYDVVTGHAVAIASRLQSKANPNSILVSRSTKEKCQGHFQFSSLNTFNVKGKNELVEAYYVIGKLQDILSYQTPFVGRKHILNTLKKTYLKFTNDSLVCFYLYGDPGIGKTRLIAQFIEEIKKFPDYQTAYLYTRCSPYGNNPFSIIIKLILSYLGLNDFQQITSQTISERFSKKNISFDSSIITFFHDMIHTNNILALDEKSLFKTLFTLLFEICSVYKDEIYSLILCIDNIAFIDKRSRDFLRYFINHSAIKPFFIISSRKYDENVAGIFPGIQTFIVEAFNENESHEFIDKFSKIILDNEQIEYITKESKGNPFFLEEFILYINAEKTFSHLPPSIHNIILVQINKLPQEYIDIIQKASVIGSTFTIGEIIYLHDETDGKVNDIENNLLYLIEQNIIVKQHTLYRFRQEIIREVVYSTILNQNKKILHRIIAEYFIKVKPFESLKIIYHLISSDEIKQAAEILLKTEHISYDYIQYINQILGSLDEKSQIRIELLFLKFGVLFNNGLIETNAPILEEISKIALKTHTNSHIAQWNQMFMVYHFEKFDYFNAEFFGRKAIEYYEKSTSNYVDYYNALRFTVLSRLYKSDPQGAAIICQKIPKNTVEYASTNAQIIFYTGNYHEGYKKLEEAYFVIEQKKSNEYSYIMILTDLIYFSYDLGNYKDVYKYCKIFLDKVAPNYRLYSRIYSFYGISAYYLGKKDEGFEYLKKAEYYALQLNNNFYKSRVFVFLSEAYLLSQDYIKAEQYGKEARLISLLNSDHMTTYETLLILILIAIQNKKTHEIKFYLNEAKFYSGISLFMDFRYKAMLLYFNYKYSDNDEKTSFSYLQEAYKIVKEKLKNIPDKSIRTEFKKSRFNQAILDEYEEKTQKSEP